MCTTDATSDCSLSDDEQSCSSDEEGMAAETRLGSDEGDFMLESKQKLTRNLLDDSPKMSKNDQKDNLF